MKKQNKIELTEKVVFNLSKQQNYEAIALALCNAGYYVRIIPNASAFSINLYVYTDRN
jgi:hypothetical protein